MAEHPVHEYGYSLGRSVRPDGVDLYSAWDQAVRVIGPMGSGKTLRFLAPKIREAPGAVLATGTKPDIVELTAGHRTGRGPVHVLDPQQIVPGQPPLYWSPVHGAEDTKVAELRGRAFVAGARMPGASLASEGAAFYRDQAGTVLACLLHAAALSGAGLRDVLRWSRRLNDPAPVRILDQHPGAGPQWADMLAAATSGDERTVGNTRATLSAALACFAHEEVVDAIDVSARDATDVEAAISAGGTFYLLGKDSENSSVSPLVTAVAEDILDRAEKLAFTLPARRLDPPLLVALDEAPNIAPLPSLRQRVADGRGRGLCIMYALQGWASARARWGEHTAKELAAYTNNVIVFGGCKDTEFLHELERLCGQQKVYKASSSTGGGRGSGPSRQTSQDWEPVMRAHQIGQLPTDDGHVLLLAGTLPPVITKLPGLFELPEWPRIQRETEQIRATANAARDRAEAERNARTERAQAAWHHTTAPAVAEDGPR